MQKKNVILNFYVQTENFRPKELILKICVCLIYMTLNLKIYWTAENASENFPAELIAFYAEPINIMHPKTLNRNLIFRCVPFPSQRIVIREKNHWSAAVYSGVSFQPLF